jgi:hypothetical protein
MRTTVSYTEADVQRAYKAQQKAMKQRFGCDLYETAAEDVISRQHIEHLIRSSFEAIGMHRDES